jgi:hypothetical protein
MRGQFRLGENARRNACQRRLPKCSIGSPKKIKFEEVQKTRAKSMEKASMKKKEFKTTTSYYFWQAQAAEFSK